MSSISDRQQSDPADDIESALRTFASKVERAASRRPGTIAFRFHGDGGSYYVHVARDGCTISRQAGSQANDFEILGDPQRLAAVLNGSKDARRQFIESSTKSPRPRVRGDIPYLRKLFREMGLMR
jgi:hypothetical protein